MADPTNPPEGLAVLWWLIGSGGVAGFATMLVGRLLPVREASKPAADLVPSTPPSLDDHISPHYVSHHLIKIDLNVERLMQMMAALVSQIGTMSIQLNTFHALLERERQDRLREKRERENSGA